MLVACLGLQMISSKVIFAKLRLLDVDILACELCFLLSKCCVCPQRFEMELAYSSLDWLLTVHLRKGNGERVKEGVTCLNESIIASSTTGLFYYCLHS
jgi:hypothetical protein